MSARGRVQGVLAANPRCARWRAGQGLAVLVGPAPSREGDPDGPLTGRAGRRIARLAGLSWPQEFLRTFDRVNVFLRWPGPGPAGLGDAFPMDQANLAAGVLLPELVGYPVVLLGWNAAGAFGLKRELPIELFSWYSYRIKRSATTIECDIAELPTQVELTEGWPAFGEFPHWPNAHGFPVAVAPHPTAEDRGGSVAEGFWRELVRRLRERAPPG